MSLAVKVYEPSGHGWVAAEDPAPLPTMLYNHHGVCKVYMHHFSEDKFGDLSPERRVTLALRYAQQNTEYTPKSSYHKHN